MSRSSKSDSFHFFLFSSTRPILGEIRLLSGDQEMTAASLAMAEAWGRRRKDVQLFIIFIYFIYLFFLL